MRVQTIPIQQLRSNGWNPNEMDDHRYRSLVASVKKHGVLQPILIRADMTIIKGEKRWRAAKEADLAEMVCVIVESSQEESKLLTISLSNLRGRTNEELLASLLEELSGSYTLEEIALETGYLQIDLEGYLSGLQQPSDDNVFVEEDNFDVQHALLAIEEPETQRGDIWQLGPHLLMCGDATSEDDVRRLMDGARAALVVTDPPYNVAVESSSARLAADGRDSIMNDDMPAEEFAGFLHAVFERYAAIMDPAAAIYVSHPSSYQREFEDAMNAAGIEVRTQCIWVKNAATFGWAQYRFKHEPVFYAHLRGKAPAWYGDRKQTTVWRAGLPAEDPLPETVWEVSRGDVTKYVHPTQKPLELLAIPIRNSSRSGDTVTDFFGGSGSTLMTCDQLGRICRTMELDPIFCDVIKRRYKDKTGIEPQLLHRADPAA
ncbi:ParB/RepB/Spo0J family partition protein [Paenibacillus sophorae]|uniref:DNA modification methylase n=1 Tax=Paenibacillus sophorae TaxID=1333845 RepID=A0A1H8LA38_9BACL|nr:DNA modification methylase [Paenibacillus sophorae]QWU17378.1 DNA modification methylase [Paenibacillus sophorae]SEO01666.1 ParB/RepB/Spo0J family partition protein [Paenibacillus sophorae]